MPNRASTGNNTLFSMKDIFKIWCLSFVFMGLLSCDNKQIEILNSKVDSLRTENIALQEKCESLEKDLNAYRYSPAKLLSYIRQSYERKNYNEIGNYVAILQKYHPEASECASANKIYKQALKDKELEKKKEEARIAKAEAERKAKMNPIERIMEKYGCSLRFAEAINQRCVLRGMTPAMARAAWGKPEDINRSVGSWGVHEQWCYRNGCYLYFEDGILTSWQN